MLVCQTKHLSFEDVCACGHRTRALPGRCPSEPDWSVELTEWQLIGPRLASFIAALSLRLGGSHRRIQEFLHDWFGLSLSTALISQCRHELGRALEPVVEAALREALNEAKLVHVDETGWPQHDQALWLWVFVSATTERYLIGRRPRGVLQSILGETPTQWIMSDGYSVYRAYGQRLCIGRTSCARRAAWARALTPRPKALVTRSSAPSRPSCTVYAARAAPTVPSTPVSSDSGRDACASPRAPTRKARALAHELLNDWDSFWVALEHPHLPRGMESEAKPSGPRSVWARASRRSGEGAQTRRRRGDLQSASRTPLSHLWSAARCKRNPLFR